jgi:hypothetical protein
MKESGVRIWTPLFAFGQLLGIEAAYVVDERAICCGQRIACVPLFSLVKRWRVACWIG